jgi:hypothetical protein
MFCNPTFVTTLQQADGFEKRYLPEDGPVNGETKEIFTEQCNTNIQLLIHI